jgi:hypothetical protein
MRVHVPQRLPVVAQPTLPLWAERRCRIAHTPHECERADDRVRENVPRRLPSTPLQSILERRHPRRDGAVKIALPEIFACAPSIFGKCDGRGTPDNKCSRIAVPIPPSPPPYTLTTSAWSLGSRKSYTQPTLSDVIPAVDPRSLSRI